MARGAYLSAERARPKAASIGLKTSVFRAAAESPVMGQADAVDEVGLFRPAQGGRAIESGKRSHMDVFGE